MKSNHLRPEHLSWSDLNKRQQTYLKAVFEADQAQETAIKRSDAIGNFDALPGVDRCWIPLQAIVSTIPSARHAGTTYTSLAPRGLVLCQYEAVPTGRSVLFIQITKLGRKIVREATDITAKPFLTGRALLEHQWRAFVGTYLAGEEGVKLVWPITWNSTWRALRNYRVNGKIVALVEEMKSPDPPRRAFEGYYASQVVRLCITAIGR